MTVFSKPQKPPQLLNYTKEKVYNKPVSADGRSFVFRFNEFDLCQPCSPAKKYEFCNVSVIDFTSGEDSVRIRLKTVDQVKNVFYAVFTIDRYLVYDFKPENQRVTEIAREILSVHPTYTPKIIAYNLEKIAIITVDTQFTETYRLVVATKKGEGYRIVCGVDLELNGLCNIVDLTKWVFWKNLPTVQFYYFPDYQTAQFNGEPLLAMFSHDEDEGRGQELPHAS